MVLKAATMPAMCQRNLIFQAFCAPLLSCVPRERQLSTVLATEAGESEAEEIAHFNRPVTSVFRTCGRLLLPASESTDPKRMWQAVISLGKAERMCVCVCVCMGGGSRAVYNISNKIDIFVQKKL